MGDIFKAVVVGVLTVAIAILFRDAGRRNPVRQCLLFQGGYNGG